jgi:hypothetical protein
MPTGYPRAVSSLRSHGKTVLSLGGTPAATVERYTGGEPYAEVVNEPGGLLPYAKKHVGAVKFADLEALVAMDAHPTLFRWIRDAWFGNPEREKVALERRDEACNLPSVALSSAAIREVTLPALDHTARDKRFLTVKIVPRAVRRGEVISRGVQREEREFLAHNFAVNIDGLDCSGVLAVDSFTVKTSLPEPGSKKRPTLIFPDIHLYLDASKADPFREWFEDFVLAGNNDDDREREGSITYQDPMLGDPLAVLQLVHLGIFRIVEEPTPPTGPRRTRVDLYCERMELSSSEAASAGDTQPLAPVKV